jgi:tetratricopeptide (TPR) repeat protein
MKYLINKKSGRKMTEQRDIIDQKNTWIKETSSPQRGESMRDEFDAFLNNPDYQKLLISYQNAEWEKCQNILGSLLQTYPGNSRLFDLRQDIEIQLEFHQLDLVIARSKRRGVIGKIVGIFLTVCIGLVIGYFGFQLFAAADFSQFTEMLYPNAGVQPTEDIMGNLAQLENQAWGLIQTGNAEAASGIIQQIETVNPNYPNLNQLKEKVDKLAQYNLLYDKAMQYLDANQPEQALVIFQQIKDEYPLFRDVDYQIQTIEKNKRIEDLLVSANSAFLEGNWTVVINSYEEALALNPNTNAPNLEEQLFVSYYHAITDILNKAETTDEDMAHAEDYYRKAFSLVPQNPAFGQERDNLANLMNDLMIMKYRQNAKALLESRDASESSLALAVSYLKKASNLAPDNSSLKNEYENAQTYQVAIQHFDQKDWDTTIQYLEDLANFNNSYANGMLNTLLYEAYTARGSRYMSIGFYDEARRDFDQAEVIAWSQTPPNSLQMFMAELNLGFILGKRYEYKDADAYFVYGLDNINALTRVSDPQTLDSLTTARGYYDSGQYREAYNIYSEILADPYVFCTYQDVPVSKGESLAKIASIYLTTIKAVMDVNNLQTLMAESVLMETDLTLKIPFIP